MAVILHTNSEFPQEKLPCMFLDLQAAILICDQNFWINKCKMFGKFIKQYSKHTKHFANEYFCFQLKASLLFKIKFKHCLSLFVLYTKYPTIDL